MNEFAGPAWDLSEEYPSTESSKLETDLNMLTLMLRSLEKRNEQIDSYTDIDNDFSLGDTDQLLDALWHAYELAEHAAMLLNNVGTYASCLLSVDGKDSAARSLESKLSAYEVRYLEATQPSKQCLKVAPDSFIKKYLQDSRVSSTEFQLKLSRSLRDSLLPIQQENLVNGLAQEGIHAWGRLYTQLSSHLLCEVSDGTSTRHVGIAEAASLMQSPDDSTRENAWRAINSAWSEHLETCSAAINAIAGWNLEMCRRRSKKTTVHYLDAAVHSNHYQKTTLEAVVDVARDSRTLSQRAAKALARAYRKDCYGPWDQRAPAPSLVDSEGKFTFSQGIEIVADCYSQIDPAMGEFVLMMEENRWIEGRVGGNKRPGAYCTSFDKSRKPRVYMTYGGTMSDITVLAHELGHGFHHWVLRDLPKSQRNYGMSLAETASTFGETLVRDALLEKAETPEQQLQIAWEEIAAIVSFLLNIPTRYEFERNFYDAREEGSLLPDELKKLMADSWMNWYGDSLSEPDDLFWVNKLHFYFSGQSFYNFPYLFGYLFSQSIYQRKDSFGGDFFERYKSILSDTGCMTAEDLARKHLDADLSDKTFWQHTVDALEPRITYFENLCDQLGF